MNVKYQKIAQNGGSYDTAKYRYVIDPSTGDVMRIALSKLGTTAALDPRSWERRSHQGYRGKMKRTSIQLPGDMVEWIRGCADQYGRSVSEVVRYAVEHYRNTIGNGGAENE